MVGVTNVVNTMHARYVALPFVSSFTEDCLGRGKEYTMEELYIITMALREWV